MIEPRAIEMKGVAALEDRGRLARGTLLPALQPAANSPQRGAECADRDGRSTHRLRATKSHPCRAALSGLPTRAAPRRQGFGGSDVALAEAEKARATAISSHTVMSARTRSASTPTNRRPGRR